MTATLSSVTPLNEEQIKTLANLVLEALGQPSTEAQQAARAAFDQAEYPAVKRFATLNLQDRYCAALSYLVGALKNPAVAETALTEASRAAADAVREKTLQTLNRKFSELL